MFRRISRQCNPSTILLFAIGLPLTLIAHTAAHAQNRYWTTTTGGSLVAGDGNWNTTTALWSAGTTPSALVTFPATGGTAFFQAVGTSNVSLTENITVNGITFDAGNSITRVNAGGGTLTLGGNITAAWNNGGSTTVNQLNAPLQLNGNRTITFGRNYGDGTNGNYLVIGGAITDTGGARSLTVNQTSGGGGGNGTLYLDSPDNTFSGGLSAGGRFVYARAASGTPLGTGNIDTRLGFGDTPVVPIYIQPTGSGADVQIAAANALTTSRININGGGLFQLVKGSHNSLTFTVGNAAAAANSVLNRVGASDGMRIAYTSSLGVDEKFIVNGGVTMLNGIVSPFFTASSPTSRDFLAYDATNGFVLPAYAFTNSFTGATTADTIKVTSATTLSGNAGAMALNLSSGSVNLGGNTLTLGDGTNAAGLIQAGNISNGTLTVPGVATVTGVSGTISGNLTGVGSFVFAGSPTSTISGAQVSVASMAFGVGSLTFSPGAAVVQDVTSVISGTGGTIAKSGAGQTRLASATATALLITEGTLSMDSALTASPSLSLTSTATDAVSIRGDTAKFTMNAGTLPITGGVRFGNDSGVGVAEISGGTISQSAHIIDLGFNGGRASLTLSGTAIYNGTGRQLRISNAFQGNSWVFVKNNASGTFAEITLADANGVNDSSQFGTVIVSDSASLSGTALVVGKQTTNTSSRGFGQFIQQGGTTTISGAVELGRSRTAGTTLQGTLNLDGGTLRVGDRIFGGTGNSYVNFHGGTLAYSGSGAKANFFDLGVTGKAFVYDSSTIDTGTQAVTIAQALQTPNTGSGLSSVALTNAGSGYTVAPGIRITGGGGEGATAIATIGTNGALSITVTNPGTGYTSAPTIQLERGHRVGGADAIVGTVSIATNAYTGGITKQGAGRLTLTGANTFTGPAVIGAGTLALSGSGTHGAGNLALGTSGMFELTALTASTYTLPTTASLVGTGTILGGGLKTLAVPGILAPGNSTGTITLDRTTLQLASTTTSNFEIDSTSSFDKVLGSGSGSLVTFGGTLNLLFDSLGTFASGDTFQLFAIDGSTLSSSGSFSAVNSTGLTGGLTASFDAATGTVSLVPEPGSLAAIAVAALAAGCWIRRRRG
jgi:autotransporter-associated beta strand protein